MKKILVVDDDSVHAMMLKTLIKDWGHAVVLADDGIAGVDMVKNQSFDLVLLDMKMKI